MQDKLSVKRLFIILVFALLLFQIHLVGSQSASGESIEGEFISYKLNKFEFQSINQEFSSLPIFSYPNNLITSIEMDQIFSFQIDNKKVSNIGSSIFTYNLYIDDQILSINEKLNSEIRNDDVYSVDFFHNKFSNNLKQAILIPYAIQLQNTITNTINATGTVKLIDIENEFGIEYSSNYWSNDSSDQTLNVDWEYRFEKDTGYLTKYSYILEQDIIIYGGQGGSSRDIAMRDIEIILESKINTQIVFHNQKIIAVFLIVLTLSGFLVYQKIIKKNELTENIVVNNQIKSIVKNIFGKYSSSYFIIGNNFVKREHIDGESIKDIPSELLDYKFLMSPVRLSIAKLLMENTIMSMSELRNKLGIAWGEFSTNTKAMESKGYVLVDEKIVDNTIRKVISLEPLGIKNYENLISILINFIDQSPLYDKYVDKAIERSNQGKN